MDEQTAAYWIQYIDARILHWLERQQAAIAALEARIDKLEQENNRLAKELKDVRPIRIDAIHYKIQELSVRELSGTLNVGLSAQTDAEEMGKWAQAQLNNIEQHQPPTSDAAIWQEEDRSDDG